MVGQEKGVEITHWAELVSKYRPQISRNGLKSPLRPLEVQCLTDRRSGLNAGPQPISKITGTYVGLPELGVNEHYHPRVTRNTMCPAHSSI